jgi:hypothetical protein
VTNTYSGLGTVFLNSGQQIKNAKFTIALSKHSSIAGNLTIDTRYIEDISSLNQLETEVSYITGEIEQTKNPIEIKAILFSGFGIGLDQVLINSPFTASEVLLNQNVLDNAIEGTLSIEIGIMGMYTPSIFAMREFEQTQTEMGELSFLTEPNYKIIQDKMLKSGSPLTLMKVKCLIPQTTTQSLRAIHVKIVKTISKLLVLTKLAQGAFHQWNFMKVYDKDKKIIFEHWKNVRIRKTKNYDIIEEKFYTYVAKCYPKLTDDLIENRKLNEAIDWYIESVNADTPEFQLINASICLELLTNVFVKEQSSEFIIPSSNFDRIKPLLKVCLEAALLKYTNSKLRGKVISKINELNRVSFSEKIHRILKEYEIIYDFDDASAAKIIDSIIKIRNIITHQGVYIRTSNDDPEIMDIINKLTHLIIRILLTQVGYKGPYNLPFEGENKIEYDMWKKITPIKLSTGSGRISG